jgi:Proteins of 100 residues with WXG
MPGPMIGEVPVVDPGADLASDLRADDVRAVVADLLRLGNGLERSAAGLIEDPVVFLSEVGLGWLSAHFEPLVRLIEQVSGDPVRLESAAHAWRSIATPVREVGHASHAVVRSRTTDWQGSAANACRTHFARFESASDQVGDECVALADLLEASAKMMAAARQVVLAIITALLRWLVTSWAVAQASAGATAGASEAAFAAVAPVRIETAFWTAASKVALVEALIGAVREAVVKAVAFMIRVPRALDVSSFGTQGA